MIENNLNTLHMVKNVTTCQRSLQVMLKIILIIKDLSGIPTWLTKIILSITSHYRSRQYSAHGKKCHYLSKVITGHAKNHLIFKGYASYVSGIPTWYSRTAFSTLSTLHMLTNFSEFILVRKHFPNDAACNMEKREENLHLNISWYSSCSKCQT